MKCWWTSVVAFLHLLQWHNLRNANQSCLQISSELWMWWEEEVVSGNFSDRRVWSVAVTLLSYWGRLLCDLREALSDPVYSSFFHSHTLCRPLFLPLLQLPLLLFSSPSPQTSTLCLQPTFVHLPHYSFYFLDCSSSSSCLFCLLFADAPGATSAVWISIQLHPLTIRLSTT